MYDGIKLFLEWVGYFFIAYLIGYSTFLFLSVVVGSLELYKHRRQEMFKSILPSDYYLPISIIVPAYNEEVTVADTVRSLLTLEYRAYEIIVVDDGSSDATSEVLAEAFDMHLVHRPIRRQINCQREEYVYETRAQKVPVTLIRKKNGGKADALNMGINAANFPYFICMDADSVLQYDSLRRIAQPVLEDGKVVAVGGIVRLTRFILKGTFLVELLGALALLPVFCRDYGLRGVWMSVFHSVSAFCNAGFDILGRADALYPSLTAYAADPLVNIVIMLLIIVGGIGFLTWDDVCTHGLHLRRYRMQSKVILSATALLITIPAFLFYLTDFADLPVGERILASLFQSVTPRTAGYNTVDLTEMTDASQAVTILLMLTGGAPGSTAGGMKVTTLAVLIANAIAAFRRREDLQLFHRRLETSTVRNAAAILLLYLGLTFAGAAVISTAEELPLGACLYETASAAGTVGLTLGLTPQLGVLSQSILILLMYFGRVGGLTLIYAAFSGHDLAYARYPQEKITVG